MLLDVPVILYGVGPCHTQRTVHTLTNRCPVAIRVDRVFINRCKRAAFIAAVNDTENGPQLQVLDGSKFCIYIGTECRSLTLVVGVCHHCSVGVAVGIIPP